MVDNYHGVIFPNKENCGNAGTRRSYGKRNPLEKPISNGIGKLLPDPQVEMRGMWGNWPSPAKLLEKLPEFFGNLKYLTTLDLMENKLLELPVEFGNLHRLIQLNLRFNGLKQLPDTFKNLTQLRKL